jgi:hypothetical protein
MSWYDLCEGDLVACKTTRNIGLVIDTHQEYPEIKVLWDFGKIETESIFHLTKLRK